MISFPFGKLSATNRLCARNISRSGILGAIRAWIEQIFPDREAVVSHRRPIRAVEHRVILVGRPTVAIPVESNHIEPLAFRAEAMQFALREAGEARTSDHHA